jgi:superfamily II DNA or RNA helicase
MTKDYTLKGKQKLILKPEQNEIVEALLNNDFYFNFAQTGIGKTLSTLTAAIHKAIERKEDDIHFILLLPNSAIKAFTDALATQLGVLYNIYTATNTRAKEGARFHIFNYSTIGKDLFNIKKKVLKTNPYFDKLKELKLKHKNLWLIADEAHVLQDTATIQYKTVKAIRPWFVGMWFLTATPILNNLEGFYYMVDLVKPGFFKNIYSFKNTFEILEKKVIWKSFTNGQKKAINTFEVIGYKNLDVLAKKTDEIGIIRALEYNVIFNYKSVGISEFMAKYYKQAAEGLFSGTKNKSGKTKKSNQEHAGARLHDLQRVISNSHKDFQVLDRNEITEKELLLINTVKEVIKKQEAVLIYFSYLETLERIKYIFEKLKVKLQISTIHEISGNVSQGKRKSVEATIKPRDIVLITSAGTESVNLQKANNLIFYEIPFPLRQFIQACGRIARTNSKFDQFNIYILEAEGTIDTYKKNRIISNSSAIKAVLGGSNILPIELLEISLQDKNVMKNEFLWWK